MRAWCHDQVAVRRFEWDLFEQTKARFNAAGIEIPYPRQNVIVKRDN